MKNNIKKIFGILCAVGLIFLVIFFLQKQDRQNENTLPQLCSSTKCVSVEIARTPAERTQGLMDREDMSEDHGMLFIFSTPGFYNFWMKDTLIPLDMIRLDANKKIVRVRTAQPCKEEPCPIYKPEIFANYVLEINAGKAKTYGMVEGKILNFKYID